MGNGTSTTTPNSVPANNTGVVEEGTSTTAPKSVLDDYEEVRGDLTLNEDEYYMLKDNKLVKLGKLTSSENEPYMPNQGMHDAAPYKIYTFENEQNVMERNTRIYKLKVSEVQKGGKRRKKTKGGKNNKKKRKSKRRLGGAAIVF